jgi:RHS repeat-associated protein
VSAKVLGPWLTSWKSKGENLTHTGSSFALRLTALGLVILQTTPTAAWAAETKQAPKSVDKPIVRANRTPPAVVPRPSLPQFSSPPLDAEFVGARAFDEPLVPLPVGGDPREDSELAGAILGTLKSDVDSRIAGFETFLSDHPNSRWNGSLLLGLGIVYRRSGYFTRALDSWERSWSLLKNETDPRLRALADRAVGELAELEARLGRYEQLERLFAEVDSRDVRGSASQKVAAAHEGYSVMQKEPERAFLCGPFGLDRILASVRQGYVRDPKIAAAKSTRRGTSMLQVLELADSVGFKMQIARRDVGAPVIVPALVQWKAGHFAALTKESSGRFLLQDPTFGDDLWISRTALEDEATGYFLVPAGSLPSGWQTVPRADGNAIWGKGVVNSGNPTFFGPQPAVVKAGGNGGPGQSCPPMAVYTVDLLLLNLHISDSPVGYTPAIGPGMRFAIAYNQRDQFQPQIPLYSNFGAKWTFDWFSYVEDDPADDTKANVYLRQGGMETYTGMSGVTPSLPNYRSQAVLVRTGSGTYRRELSDGAVELFDQPDGATAFPRRFYATKYIDPQGHAIELAWSYETTTAGERLASIMDALGQYTTLAYESADPLKITKVTDPFGRYATFAYYPDGRLQRITDVNGIQSEFAYGLGDFISALTTPYGTTAFATAQGWLETTDPLGGKERFEFEGNDEPTIPTFEPVAPQGMPLINSYLVFRNTFYWDKRAMATMGTKDYTKAHIYHWLHSATDTNVASGILESEKLPLEGRVWYAYPGQAYPGLEGSTASPTFVGRVLDDGTTQLRQYEYNTRGMRTREIDPVGRETVYVYGTNNVPDPDPISGAGIDLLEVRVKNAASAGGWDVTVRTTYNDNHQPLAVTDAAGQTTTYTYDSQKRVDTMTTPPRAGITEERTTTYTYDPVTGNIATVTIPGGVTSSQTYDAYGRLRTTTDNDGYTLTYDYDGFDRQIRVTYPDNTYEATVYERLDPVARRDRLGRWTHTFYDALRHPFATRDPEGRVVTQQWCSCGSLDKLVDASGNTTTWTRDLQNRVRFETRANGSAKEFTYETTTSRLKQVKDAKLQETHYTYGLDDKPLLTSYVNPAPLTPSVSLSYTDPATNAPDAHGRLRQIVDGTGPTTYAFHPITASASLGAGQLASVDGPLADDTISYGYDELGRVVNQTLNGVTSTWTYDQEGRLQSQGDPIGTFAYGYVSNSGRVQTVTYPNGQTTSYAYYPVAQDLRLQEIHHKRPDTTTLNKFNYAYDVVGNIKTWTQQTDLNPANAYDFGYDRVDQLQIATYRTTDPNPAVLKRYRYAYDAAGNRTAEEIDDVVTGAGYDNMSRLISQQPGGATLFGGTVSEPATVTVGGKPATVSATNQFSGAMPVPSGTSQVAVQATDATGNVRTNTYELSQTGTVKSFTYDANGNMSGDGVKTYEWDAENRLTRVCTGACQAGTDPPNMLARFTYDRDGRRSTKVAGGITTTYVYAGPQFLEERPSPGSTKRYVYGPGTDQTLAQIVGAVTTYNVADHLGSIVRTTDSLGGVTLTRQYDPWGNPIQGSTAGGYAFTGREWDTESEIYYYRARYYDPHSGRFLSEDTARGRARSYAYGSNSPVLNIDPTGHCSVSTDSSQFNRAVNAGTDKILEEIVFSSAGCPCLSWFIQHGADLVNLIAPGTAPRITYNKAFGDSITGWSHVSQGWMELNYYHVTSRDSCRVAGALIHEFGHFALNPGSDPIDPSLVEACSVGCISVPPGSRP